MGMDSFVEEFLSVQEQITRTVQPVHRNPAIEETRTTWKPMKNSINDEFVGTVTEFRGLSKYVRTKFYNRRTDHTLDSQNKWKI